MSWYEKSKWGEETVILDVGLRQKKIDSRCCASRFVMQCGLVGRYKHVRWTYCLHLQGWGSLFESVAKNQSMQSGLFRASSMKQIHWLLALHYDCLATIFLKPAMNMSTWTHNGYYCSCQWRDTVCELWPPKGLSIMPQMIYGYGSHGGMTLKRKTEELREKPVPAPLCPQQIPHRLT
jgi:hypothetical protein